MRRRRRSRFPPQQALNEFVVYNENLLAFVVRNILRHHGVSYLKLFLFQQRRDCKNSMQDGLFHPFPIEARAAAGYGRSGAGADAPQTFPCHVRRSAM